MNLAFNMQPQDYRFKPQDRGTMSRTQMRVIRAKENGNEFERVYGTCLPNFEASNFNPLNHGMESCQVEMDFDAMAEFTFLRSLMSSSYLAKRRREEKDTRWTLTTVTDVSTRCVVKMVLSKNPDSNVTAQSFQSDFKSEFGCANSHRVQLPTATHRSLQHVLTDIGTAFKNTPSINLGEAK